MASSAPSTFHWQYTELLDDRNFQIRGRTLFYIAVLFSAILLFTLLFLYARWLCNFATSSSLPGSPSATTRPSAGLDRAAIDGLPVVVFDGAGDGKKPRDDATEETECSICLGIFKDGEKIKVLPPCRHCYHCECVDRWLAAQPVCPLCRANLRADLAPPLVIQ
ncbi:RING-H2 finger protein ATL66 [Punica granatum]|nr:RING-H2 finger protein ATL66 [Punica granatum]